MAVRELTPDYRLREPILVEATLIKSDGIAALTKSNVGFISC